MITILADASLPNLEIAFPKPFRISRYHSAQELSSLLPQQDILLCRSTIKVDEHLLKVHQLNYVATASSGTDHLDANFLSAQKIQIIDAKGANAASVADYVMANLAYLDQKHLIKGKRAGVIGMGKVGTLVASRLKRAHFQIFPYDPPRAELESAFQSCALEALYEVDLLCIHAQLHENAPYPSMNLIDDAFLARLRPDCVIINAARGGIVNEKALLITPPSLIYCTDVYLNEPAIDKNTIAKATLCTPHIAGHSIEAKWEAVSTVSKKLHLLYDLPIPSFLIPRQVKNIAAPGQSWQEKVLALYNPFEETLALKQAPLKEIAFLNLRKSHQRHDFSVYRSLFNSTMAVL